MTFGIHFADIDINTSSIKFGLLELLIEYYFNKEKLIPNNLIVSIFSIDTDRPARMMWDSNTAIIFVNFPKEEVIQCMNSLGIYSRLCQCVIEALKFLATKKQLAHLDRMIRIIDNIVASNFKVQLELTRKELYRVRENLRIKFFIDTANPPLCNLRAQIIEHDKINDVVLLEDLRPEGMIISSLIGRVTVSKEKITIDGKSGCNRFNISRHDCSVSSSFIEFDGNKTLLDLLKN